MKFTKVTHSLLLSLILAMTINTTNCMEPQEEGDWTTLNELPAQPSIASRLLTKNQWIMNVAHIMLGVGNMETLWNTRESFEFTQLPSDTQREITGLLLTGENCKTVNEAASIINALAHVNKQLNELINDYDFSVHIISYLAHKFNSSEEEVCLALHTKAAKQYLQTVQLLKNIIDRKTIDFNQTTLQTLHNIDLNFRFHSFGYRFKNGVRYPLVPGGGSILMYAYFRNNVALQNILLTLPNIDINLPNKEGKTALMIAIDGYTFVTNINGHLLRPIIFAYPTLTFLKNYPGVAINQQDLQGNTALLIALQTKIIIKGKMPIIKSFAQVTTIEKQKTPDADVIQALLDAGADPELANNKGLTPLQAAIATDNQEIIQLMQDAITKKYN